MRVGIFCFSVDKVIINSNTTSSISVYALLMDHDRIIGAGEVIALSRSAASRPNHPLQCSLVDRCGPFRLFESPSGHSPVPSRSFSAHTNHHQKVCKWLSPWMREYS